MERYSRHRRGWTLAGAVLVGLALGAGSGRASPQGPSGNCGVAQDGAFTVVAVSETLDVTLGEGRVIRLAGVEPPAATPATPDLPARARQALAAWLAEGPVGWRLSGAEPDRWGRLAAVLTRPDGGEAGAAGALLAAGLARARPEAGFEACYPALLAAEGQARAARRGLWADPRYAVLTPANAAGLAAQAGDLALVEGILHVHEGHGALYLALGRDRWGFVAVVSRRDAARFAKAGFDLADYEGTPVRLRGDLDARFGPRMRITAPEAVESLEPGSLTEAPDAKHWTARARPR